MAKTTPKGKPAAAVKAQATKASRRDDREAFARRPENIGQIAVSQPQTGAEYIEIAARRPRGLHLWRARQGRHHTSRIPQHRADGGTAVRRLA